MALLFAPLCSHRCSSGIDRNRQDWVDLGCLEEVRVTVIHPERIRPHRTVYRNLFLQKRDPLCLRTADATNATSLRLGLGTPSVTPTTAQQRTSSLASTPFSNASTLNRLWTHGGTEGSVVATLRPPAGRTADGTLTNAPAVGGEGAHVPLPPCRIKRCCWIMCTCRELCKDWRPEGQLVSYFPARCELIAECIQSHVKYCRVSSATKQSQNVQWPAKGPPWS